MQAVIRQEWSMGTVGIWILKHVGEKTLVAEPVSLKTREYQKGSAFLLGEPTFSIGLEEAQPLLQSIIDELIKIGIRPNSDRTAGELEASKKHLTDLQKYLDKQISMMERLIDSNR